ncbi:response regulator [Candidatus Nitrosocosmicus hydrocola]|uniref:response regulator n=1 Tax=Candidatus Nitrosocosmicus hydrocola TaxID=1826872 RepID=UPI0011E5DE23|nr:response regulator [Candidatus Nitrosocosmicus hydrocola]
MVVVSTVNHFLQNEQLAKKQSPKKELEQKQILIGESENELLLLFKSYLSSRGVYTETANSGNEAISRFLESEKEGRLYDVIMLDTHLLNPAGLDIAKRIHSEKPNQKLVLVSTTPTENLPQECLKTAGIKEGDILTMPFKLSKLVEVLRN